MQGDKGVLNKLIAMANICTHLHTQALPHTPTQSTCTCTLKYTYSNTSTDTTTDVHTHTNPFPAPLRFLRCNIAIISTPLPETGKVLA
mmetsp:Transcript_50483/g.74103  ORF Transcript_50483/g.74103 Transcript_50483/m.74103 type:complete len:88 (+) Transcript_50483:28-291(+)